ncbi:PREDICTED: spermatogenesis-associated protein 31E1-like [Chinchilla lanigera]|uniref:spermatogenesis-associated protein 31E1-like n=1 Tax=Chinchilla lanigera TaxID=34839 RepID=UPI0006991E0F|nr:PREDICTED: spermatogenesis-associated protein 31E1-like [Chinchilla lanigera]
MKCRNHATREHCMQINEGDLGPRLSYLVFQHHIEKKGWKRKRKKSCILKAFRECRRELEETRHLVLLLQSLLHKLPGNAEVNHLSHGDAPEPQEDQPALRKLPTDTGPHDSQLSKSCLASLISFLSGPDLLHHCLSCFSWCWATAKATFFSSWAHGKSQQEHLSPHPPDTVLWEGPAHWHAEMGRGDHAFIHPDVHKLLEMLISKRVKQKMLQEKPKGGSFFELVNTDHPRVSLRNLLKSLGDKLTSAQPFCSTKGKAEWLLGSQQPSLHKVLGSPLERECSLLFWGLPSLHSESLVATAWAGERSSSTRSHCIKFNEAHTHIPGPSLQDSPLVLPSVQPPAQLLCFPPKPQPTSPSQVRACGTTCSTSQKKAQSFLPIENQDLEWTLQKPLKWRQALNSKLQKAQEPISLPTLNLPQGSQASEAPQSFSMLSGDSCSAVLEKKPECHRPGRFNRDEGSENLPHPAFRFQTPMQPPGKLPSKCQGQAHDSHGPTQHTKHSVPACNSSRDVQKTKSWHCGTLLNKGSVNLNLKERSNVLPEANKGQEDTSQSTESPLPKDAESDTIWSEEYNSRSHFSRDPDQKILGRGLQAHPSRKLGQISEGIIPACVRTACLTANHTLPKSNALSQPTKTRCSKSGEISVNASQEVAFPDPKTRILLEAHIMKYRLRHNWGPLFQNLEHRNSHIAQAQASPPTEPPLVSSASCDSRADFITKLAISEEEIPEKVLGKRETAQMLSLPLQSPLPATRSSAWKEVQRSGTGTPSDHNDGPSDIPPTAQEVGLPSAACTQQSSTVLRIERGSPWPTPGLAMAKHDPGEGTGMVAFRGTCHSTPMLEIKLLSPLSVAKESRKLEVEERHPAWEVTIGASMMENSQNINISLRSFGSQDTSNHSSPSNQAPNVGRKVECQLDIKRHRERENWPQDVSSDNRQDCHAEGLLSTGTWPSQASLSRSQCTPHSHTPTSQFPCDRSMNGESCRGQHEPSMSGFQDTEKSNKMFGPTTQSKYYRKPGKEEESFAGVRPPCDQELSPPAQVREIDTPGTKSSPHLPEKGQASTESLINKNMKHFQQCPNTNKQRKGQEDSRQKPKPSSTPAQSRASVTNRVVRNLEETYAQMLLTVVGQILVKKLGLLHESAPSGANSHKAEPPGPVGRRACYHRLPSSPDKRTTVKDMACAHNNPSAHSHPTKSMRVRDRDSSQVLLPQAPARPTSQGHHRPTGRGASGYIYHRTTSSFQRVVFSQMQQKLPHAFSSEENFFAEEMH